MQIEKIITLKNYLLHLLSFDNHKKIRSKILKKSKEIKTYNYNSYYFYQSLSSINLKGLRDSKSRVNRLKLNNFIENKNILDIGTNIGSIIFELNEIYNHATGIEYSENLIDIANILKSYLKKSKTEFICADFLTHNFKNKFDIILSLANHHTFDKGINNTSLYFSKIDSLLNNKGILVFESHSPNYLNDYDEIFSEYLNKYKLIGFGIYEFGNIFDRGRKFALLKKN